MTAGEIIAAIVVALIIGALFYFGFKSKGPWGSFWTFFLILFFGVWIAAVWANPVGPLWMGIAWFHLFFVGLLFALLLAAATPIYTGHADTSTHSAEATASERSSSAGIGAFFWAMIFLFLVIIGAGYWA